MLSDPNGKSSIPFTLYAMECEGELNTPASKRKLFHKILRERSLEAPITQSDIFEAAETADIYIPIEEVELILEEYNA